MSMQRMHMKLHPLYRGIFMRLKLYKSLSEEELIKACCQQDSKAQRLLYEKFAPVMYLLCLRYVREVSEAEDVMISGFMKAFNKIDSFSGIGSLNGWIRRIMINSGAGTFKKKQNNVFGNRL